MMKEAIIQWNTRRKFNGAKANFFLNLAAALRAGAAMKSLVRQYAAIGAGPISEMMKLWIQGMRREPDSIGRATAPYVDSGDSIVITAAEQSENSADLYEVYAKNLRARSEMISSIRTPLIIPMVAFMVLAGIGYFFKIRVYSQMEHSVELKYWPDYAVFAFNVVQNAYAWPGACFALFIVVLVGAMIWAMPNYTGRFRDVLDRRIFPFTIIAQMQLLSTFCVLAALMKAGQSDVKALQTIIAHSSPWLGWQMNKIRAFMRSQGRPALYGLQTLPMDPMLTAGLTVLADTAKLEDLPGLIIDASLHEAHMLTDRMKSTAELVKGITTIFLVIGVGILMLGILGLNDATAAKIAASRH